MRESSKKDLTKMISATNNPAKIGDIISDAEITDCFGKIHLQPLRVLRIATYDEWLAALLLDNPNADTELTEDFRYFYEISVD